MTKPMRVELSRARIFNPVSRQLRSPLKEFAPKEKRQGYSEEGKALQLGTSWEKGTYYTGGKYYPIYESLDLGKYLVRQVNGKLFVETDLDNKTSRNYETLPIGISANYYFKDEDGAYYLLNKDNKITLASRCKPNDARVKALAKQLGMKPEDIIKQSKKAHSNLSHPSQSWIAVTMRTPYIEIAPNSDRTSAFTRTVRDQYSLAETINRQSQDLSQNPNVRQVFEEYLTRLTGEAYEAFQGLVSQIAPENENQSSDLQ